MQDVAAAVTRGVDWVQVRDRELEAAALLAFTDAVLETARDAARRAGRPVRVIVNRRVDVALAAGADGVHLGHDALPPGEARRLLGPEALVGVSCHAPGEVREAGEASYAHLAPVFAPLSKRSGRPPLGVASLGAAGRGRPVLAQGGVQAGNAAACIKAGAAGVAVTGAVLQADDPGRAAAALRAALDGCAGGAP